MEHNYFMADEAQVLNTLQHRFFFIKEITDQDEDPLARRLHRMLCKWRIRF